MNTFMYAIAFCSKVIQTEGDKYKFEVKLKSLQALN